METEDKKRIADSLGLRCEVFTKENRLLFLGKITDFDSEQEEIVLEDFRGGNTPWQKVSTESWMKIRVNGIQNRKHVLLVEGVVKKAGVNQFRIHVENVIFKKEGRQNFRQGVSVPAAVAPVNYLSERQACRVVDISVTGIGIQCGMQYEIGQSLMILNVKFRRQGSVYNLKCKVLRCKEEENGNFFYGCKFVDMTERQEDHLFQDILALQGEVLNSQKSNDQNRKW